MSDVLERLREALSDRYAIEREIGRGGMAVVYLALDRKHDRKVALKVLKPELVNSIGSERFLSEIQITARLDHPHILPLLDSGESGGFLYFLMPFVDGESLRDRIDRDGPLPVDDARRIARELASALTYAHERGVVHRDVKPGNIMLQAGHARLADFGIAHAMAEAGADRLTATGLYLGTPAYMSPEQAAGQSEIDSRSDVYSLACVTWEMLAGQPPFRGTARAVLTQHMTESPRPITVERPAAGPEIASALSRALEKLPADRQPTARDFAAELDAEPTSSRWFRPTTARRLFGPLVAAAVVTATVLGWLALRDRIERRAPSGGSGGPSIAVLPFTVSGAGDLREGLVASLSTNLDGAAGYVALPPATMLASWSEATRGRETLTHEQELGVGRSLGAELVVAGSAVQSGDVLRLSARMFGVEGEERAAATVEGSAYDVVALTDRLAYDLIMSMWERGQIDIPPMNLDLITTASLDALKAYIEGDIARHDMEFHRAVPAWNRAVEADPDFRHAWWRIWDSLYYLGLGSGERMPRQREARSRVVALTDSTSPPLGGKEALEWQRAYLLEHPDDADAWFRLANIAENYSTPEEARRAYERAIELGPNSLFYKAELAKLLTELRTDSTAVSELLKAVSQADTTLYVREIQAQFDVTFGDGPTHAALAAAFDTMPRALLANLERVVSRAEYADLAIAWADARGRRSVEFGGEDPAAAEGFKAIYNGFVLGHAARADSILLQPFVRDQQRYDYAVWAHQQRIPVDPRLTAALAALGRQPDWLDLFAADEGRFADLAEQVTWVRSRAADQLASGDTARASANRGIADLMEAHGLMRQGAPEAAVALLEPIDPANAFFRALRRWWLGELYLELGQADNALSYLATGWEGGWTPIVLSRFRAGQAYEMLGRDEEAMTAYSEFMEFWNGADPELQPVVEDARARIAQLQLPD